MLRYGLGIALLIVVTFPSVNAIGVAQESAETREENVSNTRVDEVDTRQALSERSEYEGVPVEGVAVYSPPAVPAADPPVADDRTVDLLHLIELPRDVVAGEWDFAGEKLFGKTATKLSLIRVPHSPPREYDLTLVVERVAGCDQFAIGMLAGDAPFVVSLDRGGGRWSDLYGEVEVRGGLFRSYRPTEIEIAVRLTGLSVTFDGEPVFDWQGDLREVRMHPLWREHLNGQQTMFLEQWNSQYLIHSMRLTPR